MQVHIHHQGAQSGPFPREAVAEMLRVGTLDEETQVWHEGLPDWVPVRQFLDRQDSIAAAQAGTSETRPGSFQPPAAGPSELNVALRALACGFVVALVAGVIFGFIEGKLGASTRGSRRLLIWLVVGVGWLVGFTVSRVSRGLDSWLLVLGAAGAALVGLLLSVWVAGLVGGADAPSLFGMSLQIVAGTAIAGWVAKSD